MSTDQYNFLSLDGNEDKKEPLLNENILLRNDSTNLLDEDNFISTIKTIKTEEIEDLKDNQNQQNVLVDEESSPNLDKKPKDGPIKKLSWICVIYALIMTVEIIGGYYANSIIIMSDAAYLLSNLLGYLISIIAIYLDNKISKNNMNYGYDKSKIIGTLVNIILIWALTIWLLYEATFRIKTAQINGLIMIIISIIGFCFNTILGLVAKNEVPQDENENKNNNVNLKTAYINFLGDILIFLVGGIVFLFPNFSITDPICTYLFCLIVCFTTIRILKDCIFVLVEGYPIEIDMKELEKDLKEIKGVKNIHDLNVWSLGLGKMSLSCHICCDDPEKTLNKAKKMIEKKYKIEDITIQIEDDNFNC